MNTALIITIIIAVLVAFLAILGFISGQEERKIRKIEAAKEMPKTFLDYLVEGAKKNAESKNNNDSVYEPCEREG